LDGEAMERTYVMAVQDLHRPFYLRGALRPFHPDIPAAMVDTAVVACGTMIN
jgi:hypothetical protein